MDILWLGHTLAGIQLQLADLNRKMDTMSEQQTDIDTDVASINTIITDVAAQTATLGTDLTAIVAEIANLKTANPGVDLTALDTAITAAQGTQTSLDGAVAQVGTIAS